MGEFLDKYGGVIVGVLCIVALIGLAGAVFSSDTESGVGKIIKDKVELLGAAQ